MIYSFSFLFFPNLPEDRQIIQTLCAAFQQNERLKILLGKRKKQFKLGLKFLISYCYYMVKKIGGIYCSQDQRAILLYYRKSMHYSTWKDGLRYLYLAIGIIGLSRLKQVYQREKRIRETRLKEINYRQDPDFLYVWFLAQKKGVKTLEGLVEAKQFIIQKSHQLSIPIYMETTEKRLVNIYKRIGFEFYDYLSDGREGIEVWFGRYEPKPRLTSKDFLNRLRVG